MRGRFLPRAGNSRGNRETALDVLGEIPYFAASSREQNAALTGGGQPYRVFHVDGSASGNAPKGAPADHGAILRRQGSRCGALRLHLSGSQSCPLPIAQATLAQPSNRSRKSEQCPLPPWDASFPGAFFARRSDRTKRQRWLIPENLQPLKLRGKLSALSFQLSAFSSWELHFLPVFALIADS